MRSRLRVCLPHFVMLLIAIALYVAAMQIDTSGTNGGKRIGPDFWPKAYSGDAFQIPSSFLSDFDPARVEEWNIRGF